MYNSYTIRVYKLHTAAMPPSARPTPVAASSDRIELMKTFVQIVDAGSLSAAAAQMRTTQPTVSRRLQALERLLGVRLLRRASASNGCCTTVGPTSSPRASTAPSRSGK
jgi:hypothetical protein